VAKVDQIRNKAQELFQKGDYAKAVVEYKKVLEAEPGNAGVYNYIGDAYVKLNNVDEAIGNYLEAMKFYSNDALYNNAIAICRKILRYRKDDAELYKTLGELYIHQGLVNEAITNLLEYAERKMKEGRQDLAFPVYTQIVELNPQNLNIRAKLAEMYLAQKQIPEAVNEFSLLAQAYRDQGRQIEAEALEARIRSMRGEPAAPAAAPSIDIKPARVIEELLLQRQEPQPEAAPAFSPPPAAPPAPEIVLERETAPAEPEVEAKQDWATNIELGDLLVEIGSTQEALDQYHTAASGYLGDGKIDRAVEVYKKIADLQPLELRSRQKMVEIALESNQPEAIIEAYLGLAECLRRRELKEQAAAIYQKVLEMDPVNELALENLSLLLPELPEGTVDMPGMEIHPEPSAASEAAAPSTSFQPQPPAPTFQAPEPPSFSAPQHEIDLSPQPTQPAWGETQAPPEEEQSFIVQAPEAATEQYAEPEPAGESISDQSKVHWGRDIVEGGRQSRVKFSVADEQQAPAAQEEFLSLSEILAEFKEGVFQQVGQEEYRQHYDLGISYKEMGLLEEAISEFQLASKGEQERLAAFEMLGLCFMERGEPKFAIKQFERGIATPGHADEEYIGLHYYLGMAYEQAGEPDQARQAYENAYNIDVSFRDVAQKLMALQPEAAPIQPEPEPAPQPAPRPAQTYQPPVQPAAQPQYRPPVQQASQPQYRQPAAPTPEYRQPEPAPRPIPPAVTQPTFQQPAPRLTPAAQPQPLRPQAAPPASPRPQPQPPARPAVRPPAAPVPQPAAAETDQAPKPKPIPSKLKKPDKQRISYV
jgi:tetratricopeptide (TPR) repeat protein